MEKLSEIVWGIPNNVWIKHNFELRSDVAGMARQKIAIYLQNMVGCIEFLRRYPDFWHNQTFELFCVYNKNEEQVYNEIHTGEWWWKQQKENPLQATIISILILGDKMVMSLSHRDQTLWPVYIIIGNLDVKIWQSQKWPETLLLGSISIIYKWSKDANSKNKNLKAKIYHMTLNTMLQRTYSRFYFIDFKEMRRWWCYSTT